MTYLRSRSEEVEYKKVVYPDSGILVNKLDIRDQQTLDAFERELTAKRAEQGFPEQAHCYNYDGFKAIHYHLFQDLYNWAGNERKYTTGRGAIPFAVPEYIFPWMTSKFEELSQEGFLRNMDRGKFVERAAYYVNEINAAHPFVDGNGRAQRFWLRMLCDEAGYCLTLKSEHRNIWNEASRIGFDECDHSPMAKLINENLNKIR